MTLGLKHGIVEIKENPRMFHVHMVETTSAGWGGNLRFRDRLRLDESLAAEYANLKRRLAQQHRSDRQAYQDGKAEFIERVTG